MFSKITIENQRNTAQTRRNQWVPLQRRNVTDRNLGFVVWALGGPSRRQKCLKTLAARAAWWWRLGAGIAAVYPWKWVFSLFGACGKGWTLCFNSPLSLVARGRIWSGSPWSSGCRCQKWQLGEVCGTTPARGNICRHLWRDSARTSFLWVNFADMPQKLYFYG